MDKFFKNLIASFFLWSGALFTGYAIRDNNAVQAILFFISFLGGLVSMFAFAAMD